jgi:site-specific recombinase XerD
VGRWRWLDLKPTRTYSETGMKRGVSYPVEILERREIEALLAGCGTSPTGRRDRAVLTLPWRSGLRISEALALRPADVNLSAGTVRVLRGKNGKARTVALDALARSALEAWLAIRPEERGPLFCPISKPRQPLKSNHIRNRLRRLAARAGIEKRVHPHGLRHTYAVELDSEGFSLREIRDLLGHANASTTDVYLRGLGASSALERAKQRA